MKGQMLTPQAWRGALVAAARTLEWSETPTLISGSVRSHQRESRLKFNAVTPVDVYQLEATVRSPDGSEHLLEIEAFFWIEDAEWEIWDLRSTDPT